MKVWRRVRRVLPAFRWVAFFVFAMGLGFIAAILAGPPAGVAIRTVGLTFLQIFSKTATHNWFPDRFEYSGLHRYDPARTQPGYTLYTVAPDLSAHLIDMNGHEVHRWFVPKDEALREANGPRTLFGLLEPQVEGGYLYPNGDMILIYEVKALDSPAAPLVKLDKDSHIIWRTEIQSHHAIQIVGDKIYALTGAIMEPLPQQPPTRPKDALTAAGGEHVSVLDSNGEALSSHSIAEAWENTKNMRLLDELLLDPTFDPLHSNSLDVLTEQTASFISGAKPGNVLLSLRNLDMLVVMDLESDTIVWALRGSWRMQHDAKMLPNGHILMFDNRGGLMKHGQSRVLEIDPNTAGIVWSYDGKENDPLNSEENRGGAQRLSNGNTLINEANAGRLLEVTPDGSVVWEYVNPIEAEDHGNKIIASFGLTVSRYEPSFLPFLGSEKSHEAIR
jgi:Arylsulfotransferase (ASST)